MKRTYQSHRRKIQFKPLSIEYQQFSDAYNHHAQHELQSPSPKKNSENNAHTTNNYKPKHDQIIHKYYRKSQSKSPLKHLSNNLTPKRQTSKYTRHNLKKNRISTKYCDDERDDESDKENIDLECNNEISMRSESLESTTSFLSALSLKQHKQEKKQIIISDELTLDDICNDEVDISEQYFDPESIPQNELIDDMYSEWPSWVSKKQINNMKRKRNNLQIYGSPPSKKCKSPPSKKYSTVSTVRTNKINKRRGRRRSSVGSYVGSAVGSCMTPIVNKKKTKRDMETPIDASIRTQRIHRLTRKSNTDLLFDVLLREKSDYELNKIKEELKCNISNISNKKKISFNDLNGLQCIGSINNFEEKLCLYLLCLGADPLLLNSDGLSIIYIAMHYKNNYNIILEMIKKCICIENGYDELNQTYIFAQHGTLSLLDIALRIGERKTIKLLLENDIMPTKHSIDYKPKIELIQFCKQRRMSKLANRVLKEQLFDAVENLDIEYIESIICHGIDINIKMDINKTCLYYLVQQPFDMYDELDAKDQYDTIICLLKNGANPNSLDTTKTPMLIYPLQRSGQWNTKLVDILLYYGTNLKLKVGHTSQTLYTYAKENCVCMQIEKIITNYYNNNIGKNKQHTAIKTVELNVTTNSSLTNSIKKKNIVKKNYKRNRQSAKGQ